MVELVKGPYVLDSEWTSKSRSHKQRNRLCTFRNSRKSDRSAEECVQRTYKSNFNAKSRVEGQKGK